MYTWYVRLMSTPKNIASRTTPHAAKTTLWVVMLILVLTSCDDINSALDTLETELEPDPNTIELIDIIDFSAEGSNCKDEGNGRYIAPGDGESEITLLAKIPKDASMRAVTFTTPTGIFKQDTDGNKKIIVRAQDINEPDGRPVASTVLIAPKSPVLPMNTDTTVVISASISEFTAFIEITFQKDAN